MHTLKKEESAEIVERTVGCIDVSKWSQMGHLQEKGTSWSNNFAKIVVSGDTCHTIYATLIP